MMMKIQVLGFKPSTQSDKIQKSLQRETARHIDAVTIYVNVKAQIAKRKSARTRVSEIPRCRFFRAVKMKNIPE